MLRLNSDITIGDNNFTFVTQIQVVSSWQTLTDTANIKFPNKVIKDGESLIVGNNNIFKRGDKVTIKLGYFPRLRTVFEGYVTGVRPDSPTLIECQDSAWLLKQVTFTESFEKVTVKDLIEQLIAKAVTQTAASDPELSANIANIKVVSVDANLGVFRLSRASIINVFDTLRRTYGLVAWFRGDTVYVGLAYRPELAERSVFEYSRNIIKSKLIFNREDDVKIKLKAISMLPNNRKIEVQVGDPIGAQRTFFAYNLNQKDLTEMAERELTKYKFEGYFGSLLTFGEPGANHGDEIEIIDHRFPEQDGVYLADKLVTDFGVNGFKQRIYIGPKVQ